ncbi:hypothetical protein Nepgr_031971 [Nepenthes gracilis]|uniref:Transcription repressor n=1 Tax=Nepenthes gracilis TaxID=150966 RepID=A0AAD3TJL9_NEPGR|nr:hypothetical protein Nepgr_031971 [Nepenthes gracilis]
MGNTKVKRPFLSKLITEPKTPPRPWQWRSCGHIKTLSFRAAAQRDDISETRYLESAIDTTDAETAILCFTNTSAESSGNLLTMVDESGSDQIEMAIRGLRSERLFFEPGETNSILELASKTGDLVPFKGCAVLSMESEDPFADFRKSMEEMIMARGLNDFQCLGELLSWYLSVNGENNHGHIVTAFADLLVRLPFPPSLLSSATVSAETAAAASSSSSSSSSSPLSLPCSSMATTPCLSSSDQAEVDRDFNRSPKISIPKS